MGAFVEETVIGGFASDIVKISQVANENALELRAITAAAARLTRLAQHAVGVHERRDGRVGDGHCLVEVIAVARHLIEISQASKDDALVISPGGLAVVEAGTV